MNTDLNRLQAYPFEKLAALKAGITPPALPHIAWSIGEPQHEPPQFVLDTLMAAMPRLSNYPTTKGIDELRQAISAWAIKRFQLKTLDANSEVLPVNGTREALFSFAQAVIDRSKPARVVSPNPFYQIYEGAAYLAGGQPYFVPCLSQNGFLPDFNAIPAEIWQQTQLVYLCSPSNPTGAVAPHEQLRQLIALADQYDFVIASDECYSELYFDENNPPVGLLQVCAELGRDDYARCVVFHSLSKRSNLPGLRSGFVAGCAKVLEKFLLYRTYHGCAMPLPTQLASVSAWQDESHVQQNREQYRQKFDAVLDILRDEIADGLIDLHKPDASFYLWADVKGSDTDFARDLFSEQHITVLPGSYLSRDIDGVNPGAGFVRIALVANLSDCIEGAKRLKTFLRAKHA